MIGTSRGRTVVLSFVAGAAVRAHGLAPAVADTAAFQLSSLADGTEQVAKAKTGIWVPGQPNSNSCPTGAYPISQDECEAFAMMDSNPGLFSILAMPYPTSNPMIPKGCSIMFSGALRFFEFNNHPTGAPSMMHTPACKTDTWVMYKSVCPAGTVTVSEQECIDFSIDKHHYVWNGTTSSAADPPGCFGRGGPGIPTFGVDTSEVGKVYYNTFTTGSLTNPYAFPVCKVAPTASPTPAPSAPGSTGGGGATSAVGDPHMTTIFGARFDIMRAGAHVLVQIPQKASAADTLLGVSVGVKHQGSKCEDMYIKVLNVTGRWAEERLAGGFSFVAESPARGQAIAPAVGAADWMRLGMVDLKVVRGKTRSGVLYLNLYARHLRDTSKKYPIGGILGLDDYTEAATPVAECSPKVLSLLSSVEHGA